MDLSFVQSFVVRFRIDFQEMKTTTSGEDSKKTMTLGCFESDLESLHLFDFQISSSHVVAVENPGSPFRG